MAHQLAIDIGNTKTKLGLFEENELLKVKSFNNQDLEINSQLFDVYEPEAIIVSSVNETAEKKLNLAAFAAKLTFLNHKTALPIKLNYKTPETLGKDRIAAIMGARSSYSNQNILVIDAGTCVTYDFLTSQQVYLGGVISPGLQMRLKAMHNFTNKLPLVNWEAKKRPKSIGNSTISSMLSGAINGLIAEMNGFVTNYEKQYKDLKIVITGGDANFFEKEVKNGIFADPNLVLKGLNEILIYNGE